MLLLTFEAALGAGRNALPAHLGGVLHGLVDAAALATSPSLLSVLRPTGANSAAAYAVLAPPWGEPVNERLCFGLLLYGAACGAWQPLVQAIARHAREHRIHGRTAIVWRVTARAPGGPEMPVLENASLVAGPHALDLRLIEKQPLWMMHLDEPDGTAELPRFHALDFRSPLLVASYDAARTRIKESGALPWPTLGSVLGSITRRLQAVAPELAQHIGAHAAWQPSARIASALPLTSAAQPAYQVSWPYKSYELPGIVGRLVYPASADPVEHRILRWGTWVGVGQKTSMGCGAYVLLHEAFDSSLEGAKQ